MSKIKVSDILPEGLEGQIPKISGGNVVWGNDNNSGGGGGVSFGIVDTINNSTTASGSAYAAKGNLLQAITAISLKGIRFYISTGGITYKVVIARTDASRQILEILYDSGNFVCIAGQNKILFASDVSIANGEYFAVLIIRNDGGNTAVAQVAYPGSTPGADGWGFDWIIDLRWADNTPTVGETITVSGISDSSVAMEFLYSF